MIGMLGGHIGIMLAPRAKGQGSIPANLKLNQLFQKVLDITLFHTALPVDSAAAHVVTV